MTYRFWRRSGALVVAIGLVAATLGATADADSHDHVHDHAPDHELPHDHPHEPIPPTEEHPSYRALPVPRTPPLYELPFACGESWRGATYVGHGVSGGNYPMDFNRPNDLGEIVVASAAGRAYRLLNPGGYGNYVIVDHGGGYRTIYAHLDSFIVADATDVPLGEPLGRLGGTGNSTAPHLHYEQQKDNVDQHIRFGGLQIGTAGSPDPGYSFVFDGPTFVSRNCSTVVRTCDGRAVTIDLELNGGDGTGTAGDDVISGTDGDDEIDGLDGNDTICGGDGDDTLRGGSGADVIRGNAGSDTIVGGGGPDRLFGGTGNDRIVGGNGPDHIGGYGGDDVLHGGDGNDRIFGGFGRDLISGHGGADTINGLAGDDAIDGGSEDDTLSGDAGADTLHGRSGDDLIRGGSGPDTINGNGGNDDLRGGKADDSLDGGGGTDTCSGNQHVVADTAINCEVVFSIP